MSYENTECPCGRRKIPATMFCLECQEAFSETADAKTMDDPEATFENRRWAAIRLVAASRRRRYDQGEKT